VEYALARFWESLGVRPAAMLGHSLGEYVAACLAGVFSLPEALSLVIVRGRLLHSLPSGQMLAVSCGEAQLRRFLDGSRCSLAAVNGTSQCVVSGSGVDIASLQARFTTAEISNRLLRTSHAFHSHMMEPILQTFENCVAEVERRAPSIPFISNVSGNWITDAEATSPAYWSRHLRETVRFDEGIQQALALRNRVLLEVGPGSVLSSLFKQADRSAPAIPSLAGDPGSGREWRSFLEVVGQLWLHGVEIDWTTLHAGQHARRVPLPTYVFDRKRYWIETRVRLFNTHPSAVEIAERADTQVENVTTALGLNDGRNGHGIDSGAVSPYCEIEARLVEIWKSFLGVQDIGVRQSFFEMGGDSLLASRLHSQIRREFDVELPISRMFELETIRHLARYIAISREPDLIDALSEEELDDVLAVMESWPAGTQAGVEKRARTK
jgi:phthiocerol/phenolphthiocerol synthesis type-I polyketide synthase E